MRGFGSVPGGREPAAWLAAEPVFDVGAAPPGRGGAQPQRFREGWILIPQAIDGSRVPLQEVGQLDLADQRQWVWRFRLGRFGKFGESGLIVTPVGVTFVLGPTGRMD